MVTTTRFEQEALPQMSALKSFALQLCRDEQQSHDLVQETMLKAYKYFHMYREGTNCRAWLFQICKNSFINESRRKRLQPVAVDFQNDESGDWAGNDASARRELHAVLAGGQPAETADDSIGDEVYSAMTHLPSDYQTALVLCDIEGHTYEEIAEFMHTPVGTIRSRIHRGRKLMAGQLGEYARTRGYLPERSPARN
jgi:RNA polymerase sigma factor (sigma-70 family)